MSARFPSRFDKDPNLIEDFPVKLYGCPEIVIEVCQERGLKTVLARPDPNESFMVVHVICTYAEKKSAQMEWVRRMMVGGVKEPEELFG